MHRAKVEKQIVELFRAGKSHEEIADIVGLIPYQVKLYLRIAAERKGTTRAAFEAKLRSAQ